ncbi:MAG: hypothetical protein C4542_08065 [Dehalococcoidia bacterium]|nr:MAG: hypothetical protein C4542_08065 [Dehalococcoidia bacterium]
MELTIRFNQDEQGYYVSAGHKWGEMGESQGRCATILMGIQNVLQRQIMDHRSRIKALQSELEMLDETLKELSCVKGE